MSDVFGSDAFAPSEVAQRVRDVGVAKASLPVTTVALLGALAGAFIGIGSWLYLLVLSDASLGFAASRLLAGLVFSVGLILVVVAGAELFTGNNLLAMAWAERRISTAQVLRNWAVVGLANLAGALALAWALQASGLSSLNEGRVGQTAVRVALAKAALPWDVAFVRAVLCNVLVCLAVWMAMAGRSVLDKAVAVVFPVTAFVASGFEHSVANMFLMPFGMLCGAPLTVADLLHNWLPVLAGNVVGGSALVAGIYWWIYLRGQPRG